MTHGVGFWYHRVVLAGGVGKGGFVTQPEATNEDKPLPPRGEPDVRLPEIPAEAETVEANEAN